MKFSSLNVSRSKMFLDIKELGAVVMYSFFEGRGCSRVAFTLLFNLDFKSTCEVRHLVLADKAQHHLLSARPSPPPFPPVRPWLPCCSHGGDEDEVPLPEKGEAGSGTVAALMECHSSWSTNL